MLREEEFKNNKIEVKKKSKIVSNDKLITIKYKEYSNIITKFLIKLNISELEITQSIYIIELIFTIYLFFKEKFILKYYLKFIL